MRVQYALLVIRCFVLFSLYVFVFVYSANSQAVDHVDSLVEAGELGVDVAPRGHRLFSPLASLFIPGSGQMFNDEFIKGGIHFGAYALSAYAKSTYSIDDDFSARKSRYKKDNEHAIYSNRDSIFRTFFATVQNSTSLYSAFDAYRVATLSRQDVPFGEIPVSEESLTDLALAPFNIDYLFDYYVMIPAALGLAVYLNAHNDDDKDTVQYFVYEDDIGESEIRASEIVRHAFVAVGEEAFFRGVINTEAVRYMGPIAGITASAVTFGVAHDGSSGSAGATIATMYGVYLGYMHLEKGGALGYNVALHYWWNILVALTHIKNSKKAEVTIPLLDIRF